MASHEGLSCSNGTCRSYFFFLGSDGAALCALCGRRYRWTDGGWLVAQPSPVGGFSDHAASDSASDAPSMADAQLAEAQRATRLAEALRLTQEYVGSDMLPPIPGWSWYDALTEFYGEPFVPADRRPRDTVVESLEDREAVAQGEGVPDASRERREAFREALGDLLTDDGTWLAASFKDVWQAVMAADKASEEQS